MINIIIFTTALIVLIIGSYTDIKTREVPDYINFGLIFLGIGIRLMYSAATNEWNYIISGLIGLVVMIIFGYLMFYTGQWGGGDSKMLMGMGAIFGIEYSLRTFVLVLMINILIIGAMYGIIYSIVLAIKNKKKFLTNLKKITRTKKMLSMRKILLTTFITIIIATYYLLNIGKINTTIFWAMIIIIVLLYFSYYMMIFIKAVELSAMYKFIDPSKITEGDWIAKEYKIEGKYICGPKDLGISKKQIKQLIKLKQKGKIKKIKVKYGIPFVPSFLIAFIVSLMFGAWWII